MSSKDFFYAYKDRVFGFFLNFFNNTELAKDLTQDIFLKVIQKNTSFADISDLDGYVYLMCKNLAFDHLKKGVHDKKYRNFLLKPSWDSEDPAVERKIEVDYYKEILESSLNKLPDQQRLIFNLSKREGLSHQKIAEQLNISPNTVRNHLYEAMKNIRSTANLDIDFILVLMALSASTIV
ncbi:sigma-70 family RNA polymerase sigma factor [Membranihabitans marinus]|uniref:sigma-70 family RNA polymerase sigma factor n=1 Tax=Membranihabitans marinus TaxID=1227546 RepID=UPI001F022896|nr:sigma-70 family RNA polymerase sigma factor [Membranihabitans marinus]